MVQCTFTFDQTNQLVLRLNRIMAKLNNWEVDEIKSNFLSIQIRNITVLHIRRTFFYVFSIANVLILGKWGKVHGKSN